MPELVTSATPFSEALIGWFVETTLVASALALLVLLATRLRWLTPGPAARHVFWLMVLLKLVTPPVIHWPWSLTSQTLPAPIAIESAEPSEIAEVVIAEPFPMSEVAVVDWQPEIELASSWSWSGWPVRVASVWLVGSVALGMLQAVRLVRFGRNLRGSSSAPDWLLDEAVGVGLRMGVRVPEIRVVAHLGTPLVWCLGRPVLLVPAALLKTLEAGRWRAIVAHELAHLRRGDHWVRRLEMVAGLAWWWCPLYWWVCRRIDFEAELACDAWAVWESPRDRVSYAESLIRIGTSFSLVDPPSPALGMAGTGRSFERRLTMILKDRVERHISMPSLLLASLLAALALPSWTFAAPAAAQDPKPSPDPKVDVIVVDTPEIEVRDFVVTVDDDDDDDDDKKKVEDKKKSDDKKATKKKKATKSTEDDAKALEKQREAIEAKFGPGSEFAKTMEALGKDIEAKFGDDSDFAKKMEALGKEMEAKFGPDSSFAKDLEKSIQEKLNNHDADPTKPKYRVEARVKASKAKAEADKGKAEAGKGKIEVLTTKPKFEVKVDTRRDPGKDLIEKVVTERRAQRIEAIQSAIDQLQQELKSLKAETAKDKGKKDKDEDDDDN
jgi:beta-lactamase regulating signal transducer with metallopeptidase domain